MHKPNTQENRKLTELISAILKLASAKNEGIKNHFNIYCLKNSYKRKNGVLYTHLKTTFFK